MDEKKTLVIVLSRNNVNALGVIRSLGAAGYDVDLVASAHRKGGSAMASGSKYVRNAVEVISKKAEEGGDLEIIDALMNYELEDSEKIILIPTDDYSVAVVDANRTVLEERFVLPEIEDGEEGFLIKLMNRAIQGEFAKSVGFLTPNQWVIAVEEEYQIPSDITYPCICKSIDASKSLLVKCEDEEDLKLHIEKWLEKQSYTEILVQEYLDVDGEISVSGVCFKNEVIIPAALFSDEKSAYDRNMTLSGRVIPFDEIGAEGKKNVLNMMRALHYTGMFEVLLYMVNGRLYFGELNLHAGRDNYAYFKSGVNLPELLVKGIFGDEFEAGECEVDEFGKTFIYEQAIWNDYIKAKAAVRARIASADITLLKDAEDPRPGRIFLKRINKDMTPVAVANATLKEEKKQKLALKKAKRTILAQKKTIATQKKTIASQKIKIRRGPSLKALFVKRLKSKIKSILRKIKYTLLGYPQMKKANKRNPKAEKPRVMIVGRNYCSNLCMARSMGAAGYDVEILRIFTKKPKWYDFMKWLKPDAYSKYVKAYRICVSNRQDEPVVKKLKAIADKNRKMLLIPADDMVASIVDANYNKLKKHYLIPNINGEQNAINRMMGKEIQKQMALEYGLPVVNSCMIRAKKGGIYTIPETVNYPCFVKPNISKNGFKTTMTKCENEIELKAVLNKLSKSKTTEVLVEDFIQIKREWSILGVSTPEGVVGPGLFGAEEGGHGARRGVALLGKIRPTSEHQELINNILGFIGTMNFTGLFDVDLLEAEDGTMYFIELNLRFGGSGYAVEQCGCNLPGMFADYMTAGTPIDLDCAVKETGKFFISEKIMIEEYMEELLSWNDMKDRMGKADIFFIKDEKDPRPYKHFKKFLYLASIKRKRHEHKRKAADEKIRQEAERIRQEELRLGLPQTKKENDRNPNSEYPRVLVAGRNYCSNLCMARAIGRAGYEVEILRIFIRKPKEDDLMKKLIPDAYSKYVKAFHTCISNRKEEVIVEHLIKLADPNRKMLLIPVDDLVANAIDENLDILSQYYLFSSVDGKQGEINRMMSKGVQKELATAAGLPVVKSTVIDAKKGGIFEIPETVTYPCFIKPNVSKNGLKSTMQKCETEEELRAALTALSEKKDIQMLAEDYVEIVREWSILGLSTKEGVIGPGLFGAELGGHGGRRGVAMTGRVYPTSEQQQLIDDILKFIGTLNFEGLFDVDLIETNDGKMYFIELNMRFGGSGFSITDSGINLPGMYADYVLKSKPIDLNAKVEETGKTFVSERIMIEEYIDSFITMDEVNQIMADTDIHFIKADDDPKPYEHFESFYKIAEGVREQKAKEAAEAEAKAAEEAAKAAAEAAARAEAEQAMAEAAATGENDAESDEA